MGTLAPGRKWPKAPRGILRLREDDHGVAAVEFALILPLLVAGYLGLNEVQPGYSIKQKLTLATRAVADLTTRKTDLTTADLKNIFGAASMVMRPYVKTPTQIVVSSITVTKNGTTYSGKVAWSCPWNSVSGGLPKRQPGTDYTVPDGFKNDQTKSFILVETRYPYNPQIGYTITGPIQLNDSIEWPIRDADSIPDPVTCPS